MRGYRWPYSSQICALSRSLHRKTVPSLLARRYLRFSASVSSQTNGKKWKKLAIGLGLVVAVGLGNAYYQSNTRTDGRSQQYHLYEKSEKLLQQRVVLPRTPLAPQV